MVDVDETFMIAPRGCVVDHVTRLTPCLVGHSFLFLTHKGWFVIGCSNFDFHSSVVFALLMLFAHSCPNLNRSVIE